MLNLKNIAVGFLVSFIGSVPLGYLNLIGFDIYSQKGWTPMLRYLLGVVIVESLFIGLTLIFAHKLAANKNLAKYIEGFSVVFMLVLALSFYLGTNSESNHITVFSTIGNHYFFAGLLYSCLNFMQLPFWLGWNLYLLNRNYIEVTGKRKFFYISGALVGTYLGMLCLIVMLHYFTGNLAFLSRYLMHLIIPILFLMIGLFHAIKFRRKYYR